MDKRGARILLGCILCTLMILVLFILAFRLTQPSCELIFIEPTHLRSVALASWSKEKPIRSHDKSMLMKISAHLEYNLQPISGPLAPAPQIEQPAATVPQTSTQVEQYPQQPQQLQQQQQQSPQPQQQVLQPQQPPFQPQQQVMNNSKHATQSISQSSFTNQQIRNSSTLFNATAFHNNERRFLPLELDDLESKKMDENRYKYTLRFNCSTVTMIFVRRPERVHVEQISLELRPSSKQGMSNCDLLLPSQGAFGVDVHDGFAHFYCDRPLKYSCFYSGSSTHSGLLLADLHIHSIEFETGSNSSKSIHKKREFKGEKKLCDMPPGGVLS